MKRILGIFSCLVLAGSLVVAAAGAMDMDLEKIYAKCKGCHGDDGSRIALGVAPALKGQSADDLLTKLKGYKDGSYAIQPKTAKMMARFVTGLDDKQMEALAGYISEF